MALGTNIDSWLARKYQIQGEQADTAQTEGLARARQIDEQTRLAPGIARSQEAQAYGAGASGQGAGAFSQANAALAPSVAGSESLLRSSQGGLLGAQAFAERQPDVFSGLGGLGIQRYLGGGGASPGYPMGGPLTPSLTPSLSPTTSGPSAPLPPAWNPPNVGALGHASGATKIPGKGSGKIDTQQAMLAPGEAVLNKAAAEHLGRDTISLLNALGRQKMGLSDEPAQSGNGGPAATDQGTTQGYAGGISDYIGSAVGALARGPVGDAVRNMTDPYSATGANPWMSSRGNFQYEPAPVRAAPTAGGRGDLGAPSKTETLGKPAGYKGGTAKVPDKKDSKVAAPAIAEKPKMGGNKAPAKGKKPEAAAGLSPGLLAALMQMGGGAGGPPMGGMPQGGQPQMPMPMPMTAPPMPMR